MMESLIEQPETRERVERVSHLVVVIIGVVVVLTLGTAGVISLGHLIERNFGLDVITLMTILLLIAASLLPRFFSPTHDKL